VIGAEAGPPAQGLPFALPVKSLVWRICPTARKKG
jgi:hypothetical protein